MLIKAVRCDGVFNRNDQVTDQVAVQVEVRNLRQDRMKARRSPREEAIEIARLPELLMCSHCSDDVLRRSGETALSELPEKEGLRGGECEMLKMAETESLYTQNR